ncbi:unnamed protein product [Rotaria sp. Silwood2]|nr:unnamed protein product [Rotaria sp. Silwood2]CAF2936811.1 unnamed protein product [Rotaria sp. Silwood2]CAF3314130.1 unnamed protein product [Rotaria sp. Silwood2]CAF3908178.1 unnamed protein product [Rotaria sp. Silwood2]CAF4218276.1 unnamed protein product [Rotaria sp. Silwood2]
MEYINGSSLALTLANNSTIIRNLSIRQRLYIALDICKGLSELHLVGIVHRDFKPQNILLYQSSDGIYMAKVVDFGVGFQLAIASTPFVKETDGTVDYDAPEVVTDNKMQSLLV